MENLNPDTIHIRAARKLLQQADRENSQSSFWLVSIVHKVATAYPDMPMKTFWQIVAEEMPEQIKQHAAYLRTT